MTRFYTDILEAYRRTSNQISAKYDPDIDAIDAEIGALTSRRYGLIEARDAAQEKADAELAEECHIKVVDGVCVRRQGPPKKERAAEPPALVSPTPDPILATLVADAERVLAASGVPIAGYTAEEGVPFGPGAAGGGVLQVFAGPLMAPVPGETTTGADAFIDAVSEPERSLYDQGFSRAEVAATPIEEQWRLKRVNVSREDVRQYEGGMWAEPSAADAEHNTGEDCPF